MSLQSVEPEAPRRTSARNPRRRQRLDSDSVGHQPRRKRSKVTVDTFDEPALANGGLAPESATNGHIDTRSRTSVTPSEALDFPVRSKKNVQKRAPRAEAGAVMVSTNNAVLMDIMLMLCKDPERALHSAKAS